MGGGCAASMEMTVARVELFAGGVTNKESATATACPTTGVEVGC